MNVVVSVFITSTARSQSMGLKGGVNFSTIEEHDQKLPNELNPRIGVNFGFVTEFPLFPNYSLETAVMLNSKGFSAKNDQTVGDRTVESQLNYNLQYLDIPISLKGAYPVGKWQVYGSFGPYVGFGIFGQRISNVKIDGEETEHKRAIEFGDDAEKDDFRRLDYGIVMGTGLQRAGFSIGVNYYHGLADISPAHSMVVENNRVLGISLGYMMPLR